MTDEAQPDEGQGDAGSGGLFDSYLQDVPDTARPIVEQYLADASKQVNSRFEEAASLRNTYEPLSQIQGLDQYQPNDLQQLIAWHQQATSNDDTWKQWLSSAAQDAGLSLAEQEQVQEQIEDLTPEQVRALISETAQSQVAPLEQQLDEMRAQQFVNSEAQLVSDRFSAIEREHGVTFSKEDKDLIVDLGLGAMPGDDDTLVAGKDWIGAGFDRFRAIAAAAQSRFVDEKSSQPKPALSSGGTGVFEMPKTWGDARERATERLRQSRT